jgi:hypothetical protein
MTQRKDLWWVAPASLALLILIGVSGAGNFLYGLSFGGPIIGAASIAFDFLKIVALIGVFVLWHKRYPLQAIALFMLFIGATGWSMFSAVGFMSSQFATLQDDRGKTASQWQALTSQIDQLQERRKHVEAARPQNTVRADIDALLRVPGINGCQKIDGPVTAQHCPQYDKLKAELGNAEAAAWLDGRLDELRQELRKTDRVTVIDPRTDSITALSGVAAASVALFIKFFFAGLIECATAFGLWAVWSPFFGRKIVREPLSAPEADSAPIVASEPPKSLTTPAGPSGGTRKTGNALGDMVKREMALSVQLSKPEKPTLTVVRDKIVKPEEIARAWSLEFAPPGTGRRVVSAVSARWHHSQWCSMANVKKLGPQQLGLALKKVGVGIDRSSGKGSTYIFNPMEQEVEKIAVYG